MRMRLRDRLAVISIAGILFSAAGMAAAGEGTGGRDGTVGILGSGGVTATGSGGVTATGVATGSGGNVTITGSGGAARDAAEGSAGGCSCDAGGNPTPGFTLVFAFVAATLWARGRRRS